MWGRPHKESVKSMDSSGRLAANHAMQEPATPLRSDWSDAAGWRMPTMSSLALAALLVAAAAGAAFGLRSLIPPGSIALIFLVAVLLSAVRAGFWTGIASAAIAFLAYNFFFVDPVMTLRVASFEDVLALGVFVLVAGLSGSLAGRLREQAMAAEERARLLEHLSRLSNALSACETEAEAWEATRQGLRRLTGMRRSSSIRRSRSPSHSPSMTCRLLSGRCAGGSPRGPPPRAGLRATMISTPLLPEGTSRWWRVS